MKRTRDTKRGMARRALTVYFPTVKEKQTFDQLAEGFGMSSSTLGILVIHSGMANGFRAMSGESRMVVQSEMQNPDQGASTARKRIRPFDLLGRLLGRSS